MNHNLSIKHAKRVSTSWSIISFNLIPVAFPFLGKEQKNRCDTSSPSLLWKMSSAGEPGHCSRVCFLKRLAFWVPVNLNRVCRTVSGSDESYTRINLVGLSCNKPGFFKDSSLDAPRNSIPYPWIFRHVAISLESAALGTHQPEGFRDPLWFRLRCSVMTDLEA
jgi:hypothetical protein